MLATYLSVFVGVPRETTARRVVFAALVVCAALLVGFSLGALRSTGGSASRLAHHLPLLGVAGVGGRVFLAALTWLAFRYPDWAMPVVIVLAPLRVALPLGSSTSNLLVPLYLVLLAVAIAEMVVRDRLRLPAGWRPDPVRIALAVMIAVIGVSSLWAARTYARARQSVRRRSHQALCLLPAVRRALLRALPLYERRAAAVCAC